MFGNLYLKSRPIRLAFLIDPQNPDTIREAIRLNTSLWGGRYNPIIPIFENTVTPGWRRDRQRGFKGKDLLQRFINVFDPDYLVQCSDNFPEYIK